MAKKYEGNTLSLWDIRGKEVTNYLKTREINPDSLDCNSEILAVRMTAGGEKIGYVTIVFQDSKKAYIKDIFIHKKSLEHYGKKTIKYVIRYLREKDITEIELNLENNVQKKYQNSQGLTSPILNKNVIDGI